MTNWEDVYNVANAEDRLKKLYSPMTIVEEAVLLLYLKRTRELSLSKLAKLVGTSISHVAKTLCLLDMPDEYITLAGILRLKTNTVYNDWLLKKEGKFTGEELVIKLKQLQREVAQ
jgi:hypothetical protein